MKLNLQSLNRRAEWKALGVRLPEYDVAAMAERTRRAPIWAHFGAGNLFRGYVAMLQQSLLNSFLPSARETPSTPRMGRSPGMA